MRVCRTQKAPMSAASAAANTEPRRIDGIKENPARSDKAAA